MKACFPAIRLAGLNRFRFGEVRKGNPLKIIAVLGVTDRIILLDLQIRLGFRIANGIF
jgi:hypothetical protein